MSRKKASTKEPFLPFFVGDFSAATAEWEGEAKSLYLTLLTHQWAIGSIPVEPKRICKLVRWDWPLFEIHWATVRRKFTTIQATIDGEPTQRLINARLEHHRTKTHELSQKNSESGSKGAAGKWGDDRPDHGATRAKRLAEARKRGMHTADEWTALVEICGPDCRRCAAPGAAFVKDHITPIYQGGSDAIENLQPLCKRCNSAKGPDRTDFRPDDWRERLALALETSGEHVEMSGERQAESGNGRLANSGEMPGIHPIPSDPIRSDGDTSVPNSEVSVHLPEDAHDEFERVMANYPKFIGAPDLLLVEKECRRRIEEGASWQELLAAAQRFAKFVKNGGRSGPEFVLTPLKFFGSTKWRDPWTPPPTKDEARVAGNIDETEQWLRERRGVNAT